MNDVWSQQDDSKYYYCMDFSTNQEATLATGLSSDPVITSTIRGSSEDSDLIITEPSVTGLYVCMWIEGGTKNKTYKIESNVTTKDGIELEGDGYLRIIN